MRASRGSWATAWRRRRLRASLAGFLLALGSIGPTSAAEPRSGDESESGDPEPPRDPNELPFMDPPYGQLRLDDQQRFASDFRGRFHRRRRVQLTVQPLFASVRTRLIGRAPAPMRGGGAGLDLDVHVWRPFWLRASASYSAHPLKRELSVDDDEVTETARRGLLHAAQAGVAAVYALDIGRVIPLVELGVGALWFRTPDGVQAGQFGGECMQGGVCDAGLVCASNNTCQQGTLFELHAGIAVDVKVTEHFTLGAGLRYFAFLSDPAVFPVYLQASARLGIWF